MSKSKPVIKAAGGIITRATENPARPLEIVVVHRPRYDDWSFPKGKQDRIDADDGATALREIKEETGFACRLGAELPSVRYRDSNERNKIVRYWLMEITGSDEFTMNEEVDELLWCTPAEAAARLTYEHDRDLLNSISDLLNTSFVSPQSSP